MDVFKAIEKRHSYRGPFKDGKLPRKDLEKIVTAGLRAPSGYNAQTTSFVVVDERDVLARMAEIMGAERIAQSPAAVVVFMNRDDGGKDFYFGVENYSAAVENILLAATSLGYAAVWIDGALKRDNRARRIGEALGAPETQEVRAVLPIGVPAEQWMQKEKKAFDECAWFNRFEG